MKLYVLTSLVAKKSYVGISDNPERRLTEEHNKGKSNFTNKYKPWKIVHIEEYSTQVEARRREKFLKSTSGRRWLHKVFKYWEIVQW